MNHQEDAKKDAAIVLASLSNKAVDTKNVNEYPSFNYPPPHHHPYYPPMNHCYYPPSYYFPPYPYPSPPIPPPPQPYYPPPSTSPQQKEQIDYSRKDKSLGLLCENFIKTFETSTSISIDSAASILSVERRRIYDVLNILESIGIVSRKQKNMYYWHGFSDLPKTLRKLQSEAPSAGKSLGKLAQAFLKVFLNGNAMILSLDFIIQTLYKKDTTKTKGRRLYDITNIFTHLGLIVKVSGGKKPTFAWSYHMSPREIRTKKSLK